MKRPIALLIPLVLLLCGCATLPIAGPVRIGPDLAPGAGVDSFYYSPSPPVAGASQADILRGFLAAGTGPQNDYSIAREFLSETIRSSWNPSQEVLIQRVSPVITIADNNAASLEVELSARIDSDGRYDSLPSGSSRMMQFTFVKENGEWRLSSAPDATLIIRPVFDVIFRSYSVFFLDRQKRFLVPDLRWFPTTPATGTRIVNSLLKGPTDWLKAAVTSAIPSGTRLSIDAVTVEGGTALVDLTARALVATRADRSLMKAQLTATLSQLANVSQVAISIERSIQEIPDSQADLLIDANAPLFAATEEGLKLVAGNDIDFSSLKKDLFEKFPASAIAISRQSNALALLTGSGIYRVQYDQASQEPTPIDNRTGLIAPVFDRQQYLWSLTRSPGTLIQATSQSGQKLTVSAPWLQGQSVLSFDIAAEGTRVVMLLAGSDRNRVVVASIVRDKTGKPVSLTTGFEIGIDLASPISADWFDEGSVAILNKGLDVTSANLTTVGGISRTIAAPADSIRILSGGSGRTPFALNSLGELFNYRGLSWTSVATEVKAIAIAH